METNLKEKQMLLNTRQANVFHLEAIIFLISPIHIHRLIYAHSLCFTPSSSDKRGAMMELSWLRCSRVSLPPFPVHHLLNTGNCETGFGSLSLRFMLSMDRSCYFFQQSIHLLCLSFFGSDFLFFIS